MKKKICAAIIVIIVIFSGVFAVIALNENSQFSKLFGINKKMFGDKTIVAVVNNEKIYKWQLDAAVELQQIYRQNADSSGYDVSLIEYVNEKDLLDEIIRKKVVVQEAKKKGIKVDFSEAKKTSEENYYNLLKENNDVSEFIREYVDSLGITEKEYLKLSANNMQNQMYRQRFYENFAKDKTGTYEEIVEQYELYVKSLVEKATIEYK